MTTPALDIDCTIDVTGLAISGLTDLDINDYSAYEIVRIGPGVTRWIRDWATAPDVHGAQEVSRRLDLSSIPLAVRVKGTTMAQLVTRAALLNAACSQAHYELTLGIEGSSITWACFAADIGPSDSSGGSSDGTFDKYSLAAKYRQVYDLTIPRQPLAVAGAL